jgi:hypothetical protein
VVRSWNSNSALRALEQEDNKRLPNFPISAWSVKSYEASGFTESREHDQGHTIVET